MSFLFRSAITITRRQPYFDWANSVDVDGPKLTEEFANDRRTVYLVADADDDLGLTELLDEQWERIFEEELAAWMESEDDWPALRTREMFDQWFEAEVADSVIDLDPDEPLTETEIELADLATACHMCAWCELELEDSDGRTAGFPLADREPFASRESMTLPVPIDEETVVLGIVTPRDSDDARAGNDVIFRVCSSRCEKALRKTVPKALRRMTQAS